MTKGYKQIWRLYCERNHPSSVVGETLALSPEESHLATQVLRLKEGEMVELADGFGWTAYGQIMLAKKRQLEVAIHDQSFTARPRFLKMLVVGLPKPGALDEAVQSAVDSGADQLIFFKADRTTSKQEFRIEKLRKQVFEMTRITKAAWCLDISYEESLEAAIRQCQLKSMPEQLTLFVCDERPAHEAHPTPTQHLLQALKEQLLSGWACIIGPESSFSAREYEHFAVLEQNEKLEFVSLGPRILRTPAAVASAAWMMASLRESQSSFGV